MMDSMARLTRPTRFLLVLSTALLLAWTAPLVPVVGAVVLFGGLAWLFLWGGDDWLLDWIDEGPTDACEPSATGDDDDDAGFGGGRSA